MGLELGLVVALAVALWWGFTERRDKEQALESSRSAHRRLASLGRFFFTMTHEHPRFDANDEVYFDYLKQSVTYEPSADPNS